MVKGVRSTGVEYDAVLAINRGGLIPGVYISNQLDIPLGVVDVNSYDGMVQREFKYNGWLLPPNLPFKPNVLIVDDIIDSGKSIVMVSEMVGVVANKVGICVGIKRKGVSLERIPEDIPVVYIKDVNPGVWVAFPYEKPITIEG